MSDQAVAAAARGTRPLQSGFLAAAERFPDRPALAIDGSVLRYAELRDRAAAIAATLQAHAGRDGPPLVAVFAYRTVTTFAGAGHADVGPRIRPAEPQPSRRRATG